MAVCDCLHPSQYKELIKKKKGAFVGYVAVLVMFLVLIENVIPFAAWTASVGGLENLVLNRIPKFTLEKGYFQSESPIVRFAMFISRQIRQLKNLRSRILSLIMYRNF